MKPQYLSRSPELKAKVRHYHSIGYSWAEVSRILGISRTSARRWGDDEHDERCRVRHRYWEKLRRDKNHPRWKCSHSYDEYVKSHRVSLPYVRCLEGKEAPTFKMVR